MFLANIQHVRQLFEFNSERSQGSLFILHSLIDKEKYSEKNNKMRILYKNERDI